MPYSDKLGLIYPGEYQDPFWDIWQAFIGQLDSILYSAGEDPNLYLRGGGEVTLDTGTDELTWTEDFELLNMLTGGKVTIEASTLSGFEDGKIAYITVSRPVTGAKVATLAVADTIGTPSDKTGTARVFIVLRTGSALYLRNFANRAAIGVVDKWDTKKVTTSSAAATGGTATGSIAVGIVSGAIWRLQVTALGDTTDSTIQFYSDAGLTDELYLASNKDCYTSPYDDRTPWFIGNLTGGLVYYKITNDGSNPSVYELELAGMGTLES
jgi:hypothetical protein